MRRNKMNRQRALEILKNAIIAYEFELEQQDYETEEELHQVVLNEFGMTESEYEYIFKYNQELQTRKELSRSLNGAEFITEE